MREGNWKAHSLRGKLELFDLANDPSEKTNLAAKRPDLAKRLAKRRTNWLAEMRRSATEHGLASTGKKPPRKSQAPGKRSANKNGLNAKKHANEPINK